MAERGVGQKRKTKKVGLLALNDKKEGGGGFHYTPNEGATGGKFTLRKKGTKGEEENEPGGREGKMIWWKRHSYLGEKRCPGTEKRRMKKNRGFKFRKRRGTSGEKKNVQMRGSPNRSRGKRVERF